MTRSVPNALTITVCKHVVLRIATVEDAEFVLDLRLDPLLNAHVSTVENDLSKQREWMRAYKERERAGQEFYFIIESLGGDPCGTVRLYDFRGRSFCWGSWMIRKGSPSYVAIESVLSVYDFAFDVLGFERSHFDARKANHKVVSFYERFGAERVASDAENHYFNLERAQHEQARRRYRKYFAGDIERRNASTPGRAVSVGS